ncbi:MAG: hypothetical protein JXQ93_05160 [Flavobacteriaceae bacterium]
MIISINIEKGFSKKINKMKHLSKITLVIFLSITLFACNNSEELNVKGTQQIQPEQFGKLHNEAILELLKHPNYNPNNGVKDNMVLMHKIMSEKYPQYFSKNLDIEKYAEELFGKSNKNYINYYELIKIVKKSDVIDENLRELISNQSYIEFNKYNYSLVNKNQLIAFNSVKEHSMLLWTEQVSNDLIITRNEIQARACDATQQVILADAAASLIFWWNPPASIIAGAAASFLVRQDQIQNYGGGCATN